MPVASYDFLLLSRLESLQSIPDRSLHYQLGGSRKPNVRVKSRPSTDDVARRSVRTFTVHRH